jgi:AAA15 family ATPase/GTPase
MASVGALHSLRSFRRRLPWALGLQQSWPAAQHAQYFRSILDQTAILKMRTLTVENFSCINSATLEIDKLTVIIGPQASGKSVLVKLCYFCLDIGLSQYSALLRRENIDKFTNSIKERFTDWFPITAWGNGKFKITFFAGEYSITITRKSYKGVIGDDFRIKFSDQFVTAYTECLKNAEKQTGTPSHHEVSYEVENDWRVRELSATSYKRLLGKDHVQYQAFIPAGRSFFTSVGKAIAAFEQGRVLDPLILRFGRMYTAYKDRPMRYFEEKTEEKEHRKAIESTMAQLLGGNFKRDGEKEFVQSHDGRKIPLSALSSGQQELLPIVTVLPWFSGERNAALCYIEEPEAHLFPSTQSLLVQALVIAAHSTSLIITTHSPYVITKINNLLKAGSLGRKQNQVLRKQLEQLIPRRAWLTPRSVRAYAMKDGALASILGDDGLIDADYLDSISCDLSHEFSSLLELEEQYA